MARGRKKVEIEDGYVKERFILDLVLKEEQLQEIISVGKTKYITDLINKGTAQVKEGTEKYNLTVTEEIREKFDNDPRRAYLLGQLLTEFYCNVVTENKINMTNNVSDNKVEKKNVVNVEEITYDLESEVPVENSGLNETDNEQENVELNDDKEVSATKDFIEEPIAIEVNDEIKEDMPSKGVEDTRVGRLNTSPLMKKRLGSKK